MPAYEEPPVLPGGSFLIFFEIGEGMQKVIDIRG
jgi:hypothetical protein